ncbi:cation:proton antiporter domain-containing protein [Marinicella gelatinilytica]|uniref:cation:proton antiporter domain-containing protein n=1 Tax=Marinicella gelatinilytica TaxID=2996017 RepID=UPI002260F816|nr:cation:proton antiporter [Marinicella gelatinilytica]MCX7545007.1 cation:proton antiporter [Marinicella gelatinilytica]
MNDSDPIGFICILLVILLVAISLANWLKRNLQLSLAACFVLVGFIAINGLSLFISIPTLSYDQIHNLTTYLLLPIILADAAYRFNLHHLRHQRWRPMMLLLPTFVLSFGFAALFIFWGLNNYLETPIIIIIATALLLFITDFSPPRKTLSMVKSMHEIYPEKARQHLGLVQIEPLVISVLALILFLAVASLTAMDTAEEFIWPNLTWYWLYWLWALLGGVVFGFVWGIIGGLISTNIQNYRINILLLITISWLSYLSSQHYFGVSGIMSMLTSVLIMNKAHSQFLSPREILYVRGISRNLRYFASIVIYGIVIYQLDFDLLKNHWFAMLLSVAVFIISRGIGLYGFLPLMSQLTGSQMSLLTRHLLFLSTTHSSLILLAVWLLPADVPARDSYQAMAIALVLFSIFVQRPNLPTLFKNLTLTKPVRRINLLKS